MTQLLKIQSGQGPYEVSFHSRVEDLLDHIAHTPNAFFLADSNVAKLYNLPLEANGRVLHVSEVMKTLDGVTKVVNWLQSKGANKASVLVAIGGGIVQDIATMAAHLYYRGIKWVFVPTTLLAQCDSCIGAKCGINLNAYKNQLGCFHAPSNVFVCPKFLDTLTDREIQSGYGEILKLMLTGNAMNVLRSIVEEKGLRGGSEELTYYSLRVKREIIEKDEYEHNHRRILNYGHTFGHALKHFQTMQYPHGIAVAWGIDVINYIAYRRNLLPITHFEYIHGFISQHLPFPMPQGITATKLIEASSSDKKAHGDSIDLVLLCRPGHLTVVRTAFDSELESQLRQYLADHNVFC